MLKEPKKEIIVRSNGVGFFGLLAIVFITLKLTGYITWPWLWVLAPLWIPFILIIFLIMFAFLWFLIVNKK